MGKYMRKSKATGEMAVMEASLGVRTRAKTLALQRSSAPPVAASASYLQLRSRRLEKPPTLLPRRQKPKASSNSNSRASSRLGVQNSAAAESPTAAKEGEQVLAAAKEEDGQANDEQNDTNNGGENGDLGVEEASFGENVLEFEGRERTTRESTPISLIRDPDTIRTPGSTTRPSNSAEANRRIQNSSQRHIPTAHDMDEFFAGAEQEQQRNFIEKYNFDPVNEKPLPGRYEWEKVDP